MSTRAPAWISSLKFVMSSHQPAANSPPPGADAGLAPRLIRSLTSAGLRARATAKNKAVHGGARVAADRQIDIEAAVQEELHESDLQRFREVQLHRGRGARKVQKVTPLTVGDREEGRLGLQDSVGCFEIQALNRLDDCPLGHKALWFWVPVPSAWARGG